MKFDSLFPDAQIGEEAAPCLLKTEAMGGCAVCAVETHWLDLFFEIAVCSEECMDHLDDGYARACITMAAKGSP